MKGAEMAKGLYKYVIAGGGLAGASAVAGIRERDKSGSILLVCGEKHLPYDRPPLTKKLWFGKKKVADIFLHGQEFYDENGVTLALGVRVVAVDAGHKTVRDDSGGSYSYEKLLLATGGVPRKIAVPGGDLEGVCYYRCLDDYLKVRERAAPGASAVVIGGGFIGSEIAAALAVNNVSTTLIFHPPYLCERVFPEGLARAIGSHYAKRGVTLLSGSKPASIRKSGQRFVTVTDKGASVESDIVIAGVGISPDVDLAKAAGLEVADGIVVDGNLQTSVADIYAAGDNAFFPYAMLGRATRVEHWDNALNQGRFAGLNMAGAREPYNYAPYFFSDLFEFGYEAVGDVDARLETVTDWKKENDTGVVYYLKDGKVRGAMMVNIWDKVEAARELIRAGKDITAKDLVGAIR
jgi:NADPH-dependent 2,4-dienoyl-CoA reductase/sulfur reductase-like enzyme